MVTLLNIFVCVFFTYYTFVVTELFKKNNRTIIKERNEQLNTYRNKPIKTLAEQKEFLDIKSPHVKYKWTWNKDVILLLLYKIILYVIVINVYIQIFVWLNINWLLWQVILLIILFPLFVSYVLGKFNLEKSDLLVFFRGGKKNDNNKYKTGRQKINKQM